MSQQPSERSLCPLSKALEIIGDKWSLLVIRDMCLGSKRYGDFQNAAEGIPTNILASRLRQLEQHGILEKQAYQSKPLRYEYLLTEKGADLLPVLQAMARWMQKYDHNAAIPPDSFYKATPETILLARDKTKTD